MKLEDITEKDREDIAKLTKLKSVMKYVGNGKVWDSDKVDRFIKYNLEEIGMKNRTQYYYKITNRKQFIGIIGIHPFKSFGGFYLSVMILPEEQRKGYYRKSLKMLGNRVKEEGIKTDRIKILVRTSNERMISLSQKNYYFNTERKINGEDFYEFFYFLRDYTYLVMSEYLKKDEINDIFKKRGSWVPYLLSNDKRGERKNNPDFFYVDGRYVYDKRVFGIRSLLKNQVDNHKNITQKDTLYQNLQKKGNKKYLLENYNLDIDKINHQKMEKLFDGNKVWIFKPAGDWAGKGIEVFDNYQDFKKYLPTLGEYRKRRKTNWVLQEYINDPLLLEGRKFHIRMYYLVYHQEAFLYNLGQVYTAAKKFKQSDYNNKDIHDSHITGSLEGLYFPNSFKVSKKIKEDLHNQIISLFRDVKSIIKVGCFPETKDCYEILGADLMITADYQVKLIEINTKIGYKEFEGVRFNKYLIENEMQTIVDNIFPPKNKVEPLKDKYFIKI